MKSVKDWYDEKTKDPLQGIDKMKNDGVDPEAEREVDDVLSLHAKQSWWHRPEWYRDASTFVAAGHSSKLMDYYSKVFETFPAHKPGNPLNPFHVARRYWRLIRHGNIQTSEERLEQVFEQVLERHKVMPSATAEAVPEILARLSDQTFKYRLAYIDDWKSFWRSVPPLPPWQAPRGLAEPDPHIDVRVRPPFFMNDALIGSSAIEDTLFGIRTALEKPLWNPLQAVKVFSVAPINSWSPGYFTDRTIERREQERRSLSQIGMMPRAQLDILYDHTPGWNHATHSWHHGRRLPFYRQISEQSELMARYPEPLSETGRFQAFPRHMQTLFQWRAFPDPIYSPFATIDQVENTKSDSLMIDVDDVYQATEHIKHPAVHVPKQRSVRSHWLYLQSPTAAHHIFQGSPLPNLREAIPNESAEDSTAIDTVPVGSYQHAANRANRQVSNPHEVAQAFDQLAHNTSYWQRFKATSARLRFVRAAWTHIRHGAGVGDDSTMFQRAMFYVNNTLMIPKEHRLTLGDITKEVAEGASGSLRHRKQALKDTLGLSDEKLHYMQQHFADKENARQKASKLDQLQAELGANGSSPNSAQSTEAEAISKIIDQRHPTSPTDGPLSELASHHASMTSKQRSTSTSPASSSSSSFNKGSRSYSTSSAHSGPKRGINFTMPWTIRLRHYSTEASEQTQKSTYDATVEEVQGLFGGGGLGRKVDVTPSHTRAAASRFSSDPSVYLERAQMEAVLQAASRASQSSSTSEADIYALPRKKFGSAGTRSAPVNPRESFFHDQGKLGAAEAPFRVVDNIHPTSFSDALPSFSAAQHTFSEAVWGISKAFGRVVSNMVRNVMDERIFRKTSTATTLSEDMNKVVEWQVSMTKEDFWKRYHQDMSSKVRSIYSSLPQLATTLNVLYETTHPTNDAALLHFDPLSRAYVMKLPVEQRSSPVLAFVLGELSNVPDAPTLGPGFEDRMNVYLDAVRKSTTDSYRNNPELEELWNSPYDHNRRWTSALKRIFSVNPEAPHLSAAENTQQTFDRMLEDLLGANSEQKNSSKHAKLPLQGLGVTDTSTSSFVKRDSKTGAITGLADPAAIWTDPNVKYHNPDAWRSMRAEFESLDLELSENQKKAIKREMDERRDAGIAELSDFECMLFHVQPYVDRMMANPTDPKARVFYIMKLERISEDPVLVSAWNPPVEENAFWTGFHRRSLRVDDNLIDTLGFKHTQADPEPSSLSELLHQLGATIPATDPFHSLYKSHIDHPFLYVKNDGTFVDLNADGSFDPLMSLAQGIAPESDHVHQQSAKSPFKHVRDLLHADPLFLAKSWVRTLAHLRYQREVKQTWNPLAQDEDLPALISQLEKRLEEAKLLKETSSTETDAATEREYATMRELVSELTTDLQRKPLGGASSLLASMPTLEKSGMSPSEYYTIGGMVAAFDPNCKNFVPPPMEVLNETYTDAASSPSSTFNSLLADMQEDRDAYESQIEALLASSRPKADVSAYNPYLYMPYEPIPTHRALTTRWRGTEPLILHAPLMPDHIATGLMQYMMSLKRNLANPDTLQRLQAWLSVRPELFPYIARLTDYNERFVKASVNNEPLPYGEDMEKAFFHWTVSDYVTHYTTGYIDDLRSDQLMALSDLHILLFGNDSEKALLKRQRRDLQRAALAVLEQKIAGTSLADSTSSCPTLMASSFGSEQRIEYTLSERIRNTYNLIGKNDEGGVAGPNYKPLKVSLDPSARVSAEQQESRDLFDRAAYGALEAKYHHLGHERAAIERYKEENGWNKDEGPNAGFSLVKAGAPASKKDLPNQDQLRVQRPEEVLLNENPQDLSEGRLVYLKSDIAIESKAILPSEQENIEILKSRFLQHPASQKTSKGADHVLSSSPSPSIPKDLLPLAGLNPNDWLRPVTAQDMTLQRLHLLPFDPENKATHGNFPYSWVDESASVDESWSEISPSTKASKFAAILAGRSNLVLDDLLASPLSPEDDILAEQDEGVKLARRVGDPNLIREARFLFTLRGARMNDHGDERTVRLMEFHRMKYKPKGIDLPIPRRVIMPPEYNDSVSKRSRANMDDQTNAQTWVRQRYSSWLGQDPRSSTFNLITALDPDHAYGGPDSRSFTENMALSGAASRRGLTSQRSRTTNAEIAVPDPSTIWGPTNKSFFDLEQELRFQLALGTPGDVEKILAEEKANFIKDLEAQLIAYKAMEKASLNLKSAQTEDKIADVENRLTLLEREMRGASESAKLEDSANAVEDISGESFLDQIMKERDQLLQEREMLKQASVQLSEAKENAEAKDDSWTRLHEALENLKAMSSEYETLVERSPEEMKDPSEDTAVVPVPPVEKTAEQEAYEETIESLKQQRLLRESGKSPPPPIPEYRLKVRHLMQAYFGAPYKVDEEGKPIPKPPRRRRRRKKGSMLGRRFGPPGDLTVRAPKTRAAYRDDVLWKMSYPNITRNAWQLEIASSVQFFAAQILNGTPQGVRLNCSPDVIPLIEKFYQREFPKFVLIGTSPPFCAEERWAPRESDEAYTTVSIWVVPIVYSTEFDYQLVNQVRFRPELKSLAVQQTFVGSMFVVLKTAPELNFHVIDFSFDMDIPDLPTPVHPERRFLSGDELQARREIDTGEFETPYTNLNAPPPKGMKMGNMPNPHQYPPYEYPEPEDSERPINNRRKSSS